MNIFGLNNTCTERFLRKIIAQVWLLYQHCGRNKPFIKSEAIYLEAIYLV